MKKAKTKETIQGNIDGTYLATIPKDLLGLVAGRLVQSAIFDEIEAKARAKYELYVLPQLADETRGLKSVLNAMDLLKETGHFVTEPAIRHYQWRTISSWECTAVFKWTENTFEHDDPYEQWESEQ